MELQIQDLISSIKKDGIEAAQSEAEAIIKAAQEKAAEIIAAAKKNAAETEADTERKVEMMKESAQTNIAQAQRDAVLSFKKAIEAEFKKLLAADVAKTVGSDALASLIKAALGDEDPSKYAVETASVSEGLKGELAKEIAEGLEIRVTPGVRSGFKLAAKDGSGYFDCSDEEIMQMLMPYFRNLDF